MHAGVVTLQNYEYSPIGSIKKGISTKAEIPYTDCLESRLFVSYSEQALAIAKPSLTVPADHIVKDASNSAANVGLCADVN